MKSLNYSNLESLNGGVCGNTCRALIAKTGCTGASIMLGFALGAMAGPLGVAAGSAAGYACRAAVHDHYHG